MKWIAPTQKIYKNFFSKRYWGIEFYVGMYGDNA